MSKSIYCIDKLTLNFANTNAVCKTHAYAAGHFLLNGHVQNFYYILLKAFECLFILVWTSLTSCNLLVTFKL